MNRCRDLRAGDWKVWTVGAMCVVVLLLPACTSAAPPTPRETSPTQAVATALVTRQDLTTDDVLPGRLGYGESHPIVAGRDGMLTSLPRPGALISRGDVIAEIDGKATRLLYGKTPAWRRLSVGVAEGADVKQLNDNLAKMGYAKRKELPADSFDWRTYAALCAWQYDLELPRTGVVERGDVAFVPARVRVERLDSALGSMVGAGQILASVTGTGKHVTVDLDAALRGTVHKGLDVVVVLPDRTRVDATVASVGRLISGDPDTDDDPTLKMIVELDAGVKRLDAAPVTVITERVLAADVLTVPVGALLAQPGGGYVLERPGAGGIERITVEPGQFSDGMVEITGDVVEGDEVVVPS